MSRVSVMTSSIARCFPRVSGDEPEGRRSRCLPSLFSPRERG